MRSSRGLGVRGRGRVATRRDARVSPSTSIDAGMSPSFMARLLPLDSLFSAAMGLPPSGLGISMTSSPSQISPTPREDTSTSDVFMKRCGRQASGSPCSDQQPCPVCHADSWRRQQPRFHPKKNQKWRTPCHPNQLNPMVAVPIFPVAARCAHAGRYQCTNASSPARRTQRSRP